MPDHAITRFSSQLNTSLFDLLRSSRFGPRAGAAERALARAIPAAFSPFESTADGQPQEQTQGQSKPPSVGDLGFPPEATRPNPQEQARLDKRTHMLKVHQRLGLITTAPLIATVISGTFAGGRQTNSTNRDLHAALGSVTAGLYFTTAYFSIFAPRVAGTPARGPIRLHKALAWITAPA